MSYILVYSSEIKIHSFIHSHNYHHYNKQIQHGKKTAYTPRKYNNQNNL